MIGLMGLISAIGIGIMVVASVVGGVVQHRHNEKMAKMQKDAQATEEARQKKLGWKQQWQGRIALFDPLRSASAGYMTMEIRARDVSLRRNDEERKNDYFNAGPQHEVGAVETSNQQFVDNQTQRFHGRPVRDA